MKYSIRDYRDAVSILTSDNPLYEVRRRDGRVYEEHLFSPETLAWARGVVSWFLAKVHAMARAMRATFVGNLYYRDYVKEAWRRLKHKLHRMKMAVQNYRSRRNKACRANARTVVPKDNNRYFEPHQLSKSQQKEKQSSWDVNRNLKVTGRKATKPQQVWERRSTKPVMA